LINHASNVLWIIHSPYAAILALIAENAFVAAIAAIAALAKRVLVPQRRCVTSVRHASHMKHLNRRVARRDVAKFAANTAIAMPKISR